MNLTISLVDVTYILVSVITYATYNIGIKSFKGNKMIPLLWINNLTYLGFLGVYFLRKYLLDHDPHAFNELLFIFTATNIPLYLLMAFSFIGSLLIFNKLLQHYEVSLIVAMSQIGLVFTAIGYLILGDPFRLPAILGIIVVTLGAIISAFPTFDWRKPLAPLAHIPIPLVLGSVVNALLHTGVHIITFLCTQKTAATEIVMHSLKHMYALPFSFFNPFYYNVGVRFFIVLIFFVYLLRTQKNRKQIIPFFKENGTYILIISFIYFVSAFTYQEAYMYTEDKNVLAALYKLSIPTVLIISVLFLGEKRTKPKVIGSVLIVLGGLITVLFT